MWNEFFRALSGPSNYIKSKKKDGYDFYLAGSMRGIPQLNKPMFTLVARLLREKGFTIWSPAEHGSYLESSFAECMIRDLDAIINKCNGIALLPDWRKSLGTNAETFSAFVCGKKAVRIILNKNETDVGLIPFNLTRYCLPYQHKLQCRQFDPHTSE
jgi:hypothetical protein